MFKRILVLGPAALLAAACGNDRPHPTAVAVAPTATVAFSAVKSWEAGASVRWHELATELAVGPGSWIYAPPPLIARGNLGARPFFLTSQDQLRPPPPPAFGSAAFNAALAEVYQVSVSRTQEQIDIANYWNVNQSPRSQTAFMGIARELIVSHHRTDTEAARIMFRMSAAAFDAIIGCFDAKYNYWFIRPPQANTGIVTVFPTPQHPSYPSAHSCFSGAYSGVLAAAFPSERARVAAVAQEASLSRLYAGIHYRFDMEAGLALGRRAAALALAADLDQVAPGTK